MEPWAVRISHNRIPGRPRLSGERCALLQQNPAFAHCPSGRSLAREARERPWARIDSHGTRLYCLLFIETNQAGVGEGVRDPAIRKHFSQRRVSQAGVMQVRLDGALQHEVGICFAIVPWESASARLNLFLKDLPRDFRSMIEAESFASSMRTVVLPEPGHSLAA